MNIAVCVNTLRDDVLTGIGYTSIYYINNLAEQDNENTYFLFSNREILHKEKINSKLRFFHSGKNSFLKKRLDYFNKRIKMKKTSGEPFLFLSVRRFFYKILNEFCFYVKIRDEIKKNKIDLLFFMDISGVIQFYPKRITKIVIVYDLVWERFPETMDITHRIRMKVLANNFLRNSDGVIAISNSTRNDCVNFLNLKTPIEVIHLGVDRERFKVSPPDKVKGVLQKYNISKKYILAVGTLEPRKNLIKLIKAFSLMENNNLYQLVLVGSRGWGDTDISEIIKQYNLHSSAVITGYVQEDDLDSLYTGAEVFAYPSIYEGFGLPILEAMSCGCPVITSNNSSLHEVANDAAIFINAEDVEDLKAALENVLNNPDLRIDMKKKGFENINKFSWEKAARQAIGVFEKI